MKHKQHYIVKYIAYGTSTKETYTCIYSARLAINHLKMDINVDKQSIHMVRVDED